MSNYRTPLQIHLSWHWVTDVLPSRLPQLFVGIVGCIVGGQDGDVNCLHDIFLLQNLDSHSRACIQIPNRKGSIQNPAGTQIRTARHWAYNFWVQVQQALWACLPIEWPGLVTPSETLCWRNDPFVSQICAFQRRSFLRFGITADASYYYKECLLPRRINYYPTWFYERSRYGERGGYINPVHSSSRKDNQHLLSLWFLAIDHSFFPSSFSHAYLLSFR